jgi:hypothetical protein
MEVRSLSKEFAGESSEKLQEIISFKWGTDHPVELSVRQEVAEKLERFKFPVAEKGESKTTRVVYKLDEERASNLYVVSLEGGPSGLYTVGLKDELKSAGSKYPVNFVDLVAQKMFTKEECKPVSDLLTDEENRIYQPTNGYNLSQCCYKLIFNNHPTTSTFGGAEVFFFALYEKKEGGFEFVGIFTHQITKGRVKFLKENKPNLYPNLMIKDRGYSLQVKGGKVPTTTFDYASIDYVNGEDIPAERIKEAVPAWNAFMDEYVETQAKLRRKYITLAVRELERRVAPTVAPTVGTNPKSVPVKSEGDYSDLDDEIPF